MRCGTLKILHFILLLVVLSFACNLPSGASGRLVEAANSPSAATTASPTVTATLAPVVHVVQPADKGVTHESTAHDNEESGIYEYRDVKFGDVFDVNRFERPFTTVEMSYLPYIDIFDFEMTSDTAWYYVDIKMIGVIPGGVQGTFGIEFDLDVDGRAEILILLLDPGAQWSTDRVRVYLDGNGDIGGQQSLPDLAYSGNGFDTLIFDAGYGEDPDLAWARAAIKTRPVVQIAFKKTLLRSYQEFMWSVFASANPVDPAKFYYNDTYTEAGAGSPDKENEYYPIKEIAGFDNSCRVPTGFEATGFEPLGCRVSIPVVKGEAPPPAPGEPLLIWHLQIDWCAIMGCGPIVK